MQTSCISSISTPLDVLPSPDFPKEDIFNPFTQEKKMEAENKKFINTLDTSKNNNQLFQIKKIIEERRRNN